MNLQNIIKTARLFSIIFALTLASCGGSTVRQDGPGLDLSKDFERVQAPMTYKSLATLDLDQMNDLIQVKLNEYTKQNNLQALREAAMIVLARPDDDGTVEKILSSVRNPLEEEGQWQPTVEALVRQGVETLQNREASQTDQVTSGVILENIIAEFKPVYIKQYQTGGFETNIINFIADSNLAYSKNASKERGLYLMRNNLNPSQIAKKIAISREKYAEKDQKNEAKEKNKK
ncbi:MAG: hypothetical protein H7235_04530 [Bdellovibrionaceae bacterium]|nr:hypothetical protein [Pseudobdellovibrionaceae bacterium]